MAPAGLEGLRTMAGPHRGCTHGGVPVMTGAPYPAWQLHPWSSRLLFMVSDSELPQLEGGTCPPQAPRAGGLWGRKRA